MGTPAYKAKLYSSGTATTMTAEPAAASGTTGRLFEITNAAKRVISREDAVSVFGNAILISDSNYKIDYLTGKIRFGTAPATPVTVTGKYIPLTEIAGAFSYSLEIGGEILSDDNFKDCRVSECHQKTYGLNDVKVSLDLHSIQNSITNFQFYLEKVNKNPVLIKISPGGLDFTYVGWFVVESANTSGEVAGMDDASVSFALDGEALSSFTSFGGSFVGGVSFFGLAAPWTRYNADFAIMDNLSGRNAYKNFQPGYNAVLSWNTLRWELYDTLSATLICQSRAPHGLTPDLVAQWETPGAVLLPLVVAVPFNI